RDPELSHRVTGRQARRGCLSSLAQTPARVGDHEFLAVLFLAVWRDRRVMSFAFWCRELAVDVIVANEDLPIRGYHRFDRTGYRQIEGRRVRRGGVPPCGRIAINDPILNCVVEHAS